MTLESWTCSICGKKYKSKNSYDVNVGMTFGIEPNQKKICISCVNKGHTEVKE